MTNSKNTPKPCKCNCGLVANSKRDYRPGHDAKHVSVLVKATIAGETTVEAAHKALASMPLVVKYDNALAKRQAKPARTINWEDIDTDEIKIGRWTYPLRGVVIDDGHGGSHYGDEVQYNTKRDGSGEWVDTNWGDPRIQGR